MTNLSATIDKLKFTDNVLRFQITVETDDPSDMEPSYTIVRLHRDFGWLNSRLRDNKQYLGIYLPKLPPTASAESNRSHFNRILSTLPKMSEKGREQLEKQFSSHKIHELKIAKQNHQHYLNQILEQPQLRNDPFFKLFLQTKDQLPGADRINKNTLYKKMDLLSDSCTKSKLGLVTPFKSLCSTCLNLQNMLENNYSITDCLENICYGMSAFSIYSGELAEKADLAGNWRRLSETFLSLNEETQNANNSAKDQFLHGLFESLGLTCGQKFLILSNYFAEMTCKSIEEDIQREETKRNDTSNLKQELEQHIKICGELDKLMTPELERLEEMNQENYKSVFSAFCAGQLASSKEIGGHH